MEKYRENWDFPLVQEIGIDIIDSFNELIADKNTIDCQATYNYRGKGFFVTVTRAE